MTMDIVKGNCAIRLANCHAGYAAEVERNFSTFFWAVKPTEENGLLIADFSTPRVHELRDFGEFELTSLPEEPDVLNGYTQHHELKATNMVFDCGAYCGATTINFARQCKHVFAFEPDPKNRAALVRNLERHSVTNVTVLPFALAAQSGSEVFNTESTPGSALPRCNGRASFDGIATVETMALAEAFDKFGRPDFIKLDIEGAEIEVLESSLELLRRWLTPLAIDTNHPMPSGKWTREKVEPILRSIGYEFVESSREWGGYWMTWAKPWMSVLVVIPVHDRMAFLNNAIYSVGEQTRKADCITVTGNVGPGVITDAPLAERINQAIETSDCDAFILLCDDDALAPTYIEKTVTAMAANGADIVYTDTEFFGDLTLRHYGQERTRPWSSEINKHNTAQLSALTRRSLWRRVGGWADVPLFDWDFWWRCYHAGASAVHVPEPLAMYRVHKDQETFRIDLGKATIAAQARQRSLLKDRSWLQPL